MSDRNYLPEEFEPSKYHVICGRGKKSYGHVGNQWFLTVVSSRINDYAKADTKQEKSEIVHKLVAEIRDAGGFIRQDEQTGRYFRVAEGEGRDKVSQALRDALKHKYKSSKDVKRTNRKAKRMATRQHSMGSRRGSMGSHHSDNRSVGSGYYSGAEVEAVGSAPSPMLNGATTPTMIHTGNMNLPQDVTSGPNIMLGMQPNMQQAMQQQQRNMGGGGAEAAASWNANMYGVSGMGNNGAIAPTTQSSAGVSNLQQHQSFPGIDISALGYNQTPHEIARQVSGNGDQFQGSEFQQHRRPSTGASSYASNYSGSARDYWSQGQPDTNDWENDQGDVDLEFCLDLDDMEQQAAAMGVDVADLVYAQPGQRPNGIPSQVNRPQPGTLAHQIQQQQLLQQQQQQALLQQQQKNAHANGIPGSLNIPNQQNLMNNNGSDQMRMQIQHMLAASQFPQNIQQQQQAMMQMNMQNAQQVKGARLTAANLAAMNNYAPTSSVSVPRNVQHPTAPPQHIDSNGRVSYDV